MILESFRIAWKSIRASKMRSFLTMLGIIIGVFALVVLVSLVSGASNEITDAVNSIGTNMISVNILDDDGKPLKMSDIQMLADEDVITAIAPAASATMTATSSLAEKSVSVTGTTAAYRDIHNLNLASGRFLLPPDTDNHTQVAVINHDLAIDVLGRTNVVGEKIRLSGQNFTVIGVLEESDQNSMMSMLGNTYEAYIPFSTLQRSGSHVGTSVSAFYASASDENLDEAERVIHDYLKKHFDDEDAYMLFNQSTIADVMSEITGVLSLLLGGIAAISLLVGGIGIMNIMLVSVSERTREIGIRKALGAKERTILLQFLIEALLVSLLGCAIGLCVSWLALQIINRIGDVSYGVDPGIALISVIFSLTIGLLFGLYPARKAARKDPIESLRDE